MGNVSLTDCRCCAPEWKLGITLTALFFISDFAVGLFFFYDPEGIYISIYLVINLSCNRLVPLRICSQTDWTSFCQIHLDQLCQSGVRQQQVHQLFNIV